MERSPRRTGLPPAEGHAPQGDALFDSLAKVAEAYGGTPDVARLASVLEGLELGDIPPELSVAVAETLTYVYALDQAVETHGLPAPELRPTPDALIRATQQLGEALGQTGSTIMGALGGKGALWPRRRKER